MEAHGEWLGASVGPWPLLRQVRGVEPTRTKLCRDASKHSSTPLHPLQPGQAQRLLSRTRATHCLRPQCLPTLLRRNESCPLGVSFLLLAALTWFLPLPVEAGLLQLPVASAGRLSSQGGTGLPGPSFAKPSLLLVPPRPTANGGSGGTLLLRLGCTAGPRWWRPASIPKGGAGHRLGWPRPLTRTRRLAKGRH